jgi:PPK2 family polyphosphate:nucleotide phosphotransferase
MKEDKNILAEPGKKFSLKDFDPSYTANYKNKQEAQEKLEKDIDKLSSLQDKLYAMNKYSVLIIFQAMDAAGKDGTIKHVMSGINPQGCRVCSFKQPAPEELNHDFLWRTHKVVPEKGMIGIFNRSYYEEVLILKVHPELLQKQNIPEIQGLNHIPEVFWEERYKMINHYEKLLYESGTLIVKFFLHLSKQEQKKRFLKRIDDEDRSWKFTMSDIKERSCWNDYQKAYADCIENTSTKIAPWYVIPADNKWFMRVAVGDILVKKLEELSLKYPDVNKDQRKELEMAKKMLESEENGG